MVRILEAANVLRAAGLTVVEVPGWRTRGRELTAIRGGVAHHTASAATARGDYPTLGLIRDGRTGIPGPLSQLGLGRSGVWYVIASGRANHAGKVHARYATTHSNDYSIGVEAEHPGRGSWPSVQYAAYVRGCAALGRHYGITWYGHKEVAAPTGRKVDPTFDMNLFRASVTATQAALTKPGGGGLPNVTPGELPEPLTGANQEDDLMFLIQRNGKSISLVAGGGWRGPLSGPTAQAVQAAGVPLVNLTDGQYDIWTQLLPPIDPAATTTQILAAVQSGGLEEETLVPLLAPVLAAHLAPLLSMLPDADLERIAEEVADVMSTRLSG